MTKMASEWEADKKAQKLEVAAAHERGLLDSHYAITKLTDLNQSLQVCHRFV